MAVNTTRNTLLKSDLALLLTKAGVGRKATFARRQCVFAQGDRAETLYLLERGRVKLAAVSSSGKQAIIRICHAGEFVGEECILGSTTRATTAIVTEPCSMLVIHHTAMLSALHAEPLLADYFIRLMLRRNLYLQGEIASDRCHSAEHRLARALLLLAGSERANPEGFLPRITHEELAEIVGTTRPRITQFIAKMSATGYISNNGQIRVDRRRLADLLETPE